MNAVSLPARIAYAVVAIPLGWVGGFYSCMQLLPPFTASHPQLDPSVDGSGLFRISICAGAAIAFTAALFALTLPWIRHRNMTGRAGRMAFCSGLVVLGSILFADLGFRIVYDFLFAGLLTYLLAFTIVRYGIVDAAQSRSIRRSSRRPYVSSRRHY
ncbi:MAG: hypothetical protein M3O31_13255 [Acidobacteriota bacterium]|nr:hypothetical protein [Acidobacteriota bacterium]